MLGCQVKRVRPRARRALSSALRAAWPALAASLATGRFEETRAPERGPERPPERSEQGVRRARGRGEAHASRRLRRPRASANCPSRDGRVGTWWV